MKINYKLSKKQMIIGGILVLALSGYYFYKSSLSRVSEPEPTAVCTVYKEALALDANDAKEHRAINYVMNVHCIMDGHSVTADGSGEVRINGDGTATYIEPGLIIGISNISDEGTIQLNVTANDLKASTSFAAAFYSADRNDDTEYGNGNGNGTPNGNVTHGPAYAAGITNNESREVTSNEAILSADGKTVDTVNETEVFTKDSKDCDPATNRPESDPDTGSQKDLIPTIKDLKKEKEEKAKKDKVILVDEVEAIELPENIENHFVENGVIVEGEKDRKAAKAEYEELHIYVNADETISLFSLNGGMGKLNLVAKKISGHTYTCVDRNGTEIIVTIRQHGDVFETNFGDYRF